MPCEGCNQEPRIVALEKDAERNQHTHKEFYDILEKIKINGAVGDEKYNAVLSTCIRVEAKVDEVLAKPSKRWDSVVGAVIAAIVAFVAGYILK